MSLLVLAILATLPAARLDMSELRATGVSAGSDVARWLSSTSTEPVALLSNDGSSFFVRFGGKNAFEYSARTGKRLMEDNLFVVSHAGQVKAATESQVHYMPGNRMYVFATGRVVGATDANLLFAMLPITRTSAPPNGDEPFFLARINSKARGENPNTIVRCPDSIRKPLVYFHLPTFLSGNTLYFVGNRSSDSKRLNLQMFKWDGMSASVDTAKAIAGVPQAFTSFTGKWQMGSLRLKSIDVYSGKVLYMDAKAWRIREYSTKDGRFIEASLPKANGSSPMPSNVPMTYYRGNLILWFAPQQGVLTPIAYTLDRASKRWSSLGNYDILGVSAGQSWLMARNGRGEIVMGQP